MQTTLLGLAIALILALITTLVGPHFVDWNQQRDFFEAEASKLIGIKTRVAGNIEVRMLPFPSVRMAGISIGPEGEASRLSARLLRIEFGLAHLMRGEVRAVEMRLVKPEFSLGLNSLGQIDWPAVALSGETLSIDRLYIEDGRATLVDALSNTRVVLDQLQFDGEVRSLTGPFRGKGVFVNAGSAYGYTLSAGRYSADGVRLRLGLNTDERPLTIEADGLLTFDRAAPGFDGSLMLARPVGVMSASGKVVAQEPWRLTSKLRLNHRSALLDQVSFQYGPDERAAKLDGAAEMKFGEQPRLEGALSARQIDLDRLLATPEMPRRVPFAAVQGLGELFGSAVRPSFPTTLRIGVDMVTVGGAPLHAVGGDLHSDGAAWYLDKLEFRAPGFTQVKLRGRLDPVGTGLGYSGAASVEANDPTTLVSWLARRPGGTTQIKPWQAKGEVTLSADRIAIEGLRSEFERSIVEGRLAYLWPTATRAARLDANLSAGELDLDAVLGFGNSALSGMGLEWPREVSLALDVERARIAGFEARGTTAHLKFDPGGLAIERLSIGDFGDAGIEAKGRIQTTPSPGGNITVDLDARQLNAVLTLADRFTPALAEPLRRLAGREKTAKLRASVSLLNSSTGKAHGRLDLTGRVGAFRVNVSAGATGKPEAFDVTDLGALRETDVRLEGQFEADEGSRLLSLLGFNRLADKRPARLNLVAKGPLGRDLQFDGKLSSSPVDVEGKGTLRIGADQPATVNFDRLAGKIGGSPVQGQVSLRFGDTTQIDGTIETEALDAPAVIAAAIGTPAPRTEQAWSSEPFNLIGSNVTGQLAFKAQRAALSPTLIARELRGVAQFGPQDVVFDGIEGRLASGRLSGRLALSNGAIGLSARATFALKDAQAGEIFTSGSRSAISGRLQFSTEIEGAGRSPAAVAGSLSGKGSIAIESGQFAGLNPHVFDAVIRAVDIGVSIDNNRIREFVDSTLDTATLPVARAEASITINAGQARFGNIVTRSNDAALEVSANFDLIDSMFDALITLNGAQQTSSGLHPSVLVALKGPLLAPKRAIDTSLLASWLALRAAEQQAKRLDAMERAQADMVATAAADAMGAVPRPKPMPDTVAATPVAVVAPVVSAAPVTMAPPVAAPAPVVSDAPTAALRDGEVSLDDLPPQIPQAVRLKALPKPRPVFPAENVKPTPTPRPAPTRVGRPLDLVGAHN